MMAACMEQKRLGLANKTIRVVPKPLIGQTASEYLRLYPSANILVATERDLKRAAESSSYQGLRQVTMTVLSCRTRSLRKSRSQQRERKEYSMSRLMKSAMRLMR